MTTYIGLLRKAQGVYGVDFPDFPGCITAGKKLDDAIKCGIEALNAHVHLMASKGEIPPKPSSLEEILGRPDNKEAAVFLVDVKTAYAIGRINVTIREEGSAELAKILEELVHVFWKLSQYEKAHGLTRSFF